MAPVEAVGIARAVQGREARYPLLARSLEAVGAAYDTKVEWVFGDELAPTSWFNWTQIIRTPFGMSVAMFASATYGVEWRELCNEQLERHLAAIESTLLDGRLEKRTIYRIDHDTGLLEGLRYVMAGGARFYLGRDPEDGDLLSLRLLRDTVLLDRTTPDLDGREAEYLTEFSLVVVPKEKT